MKISQLTAEQGIEAIADILIPIANIAEDEDATSVLVKMQPKNGESPIQTVSRVIRMGLSDLLKKHKSDLIKILAVVNCKTEEEYSKEAGLITLAKDLYELSKDEELRYFLSSAQKTEQEESSGEAQVISPADRSKD